MINHTNVIKSSVLGAIAGDIIGSRFEFNNYYAKDFVLFGQGCYATDDSIMTLAVVKALLDADGDNAKLEKIVARTMQQIGRPFPNCGYGGHFHDWIYSDNPKPYNSFGNGAAMRVSPVAMVACDRDEVHILSRIVTAVSHNHPEGIKGAEATAVASYMAFLECTKEQIRDCMESDYYKVDFSLAEVRPYPFDETCQNTLPVALAAFYEADSYEDAIRNAVSIGGDSDTIAAITGSIAGAYYGVPTWLRQKALAYLPQNLLSIYLEFEKTYR